MQIYDFIGIKKQIIAGIKNPHLNIEGTCTKPDVSFVVLEDGDEIEYERYKTIEENGFGIKARLHVDSKYIKVYVLDGNRRLLIFSSKMNLFNRIAFRIELFVTNFNIYLKVALPIFGRSIKLAWERHRLLIPFNLWKGYYKKYRQTVC